MNDLANILGIEKPSLELLEAAGFINARLLAQSDSGQVTAELRQANEVLQICGQPPSEAEVSQWIGRAREIAGAPIDKPGAKSPAPVTQDTLVTQVTQVEQLASVNFEATPEGLSMLAVAPLALPLPARVLMNHQLAVADIPPALMLSEYRGDFKIRTTRQVPESRAPIQVMGTSPMVRIAENTGGQRLEIDTSRVRATTDAAPLRDAARHAVTAPVDERIDLLRAPRASTNKGRDPKSRRYIRGVLHSHPVGIYVGSLATLLLMALAPLAVVSAMLLLLSREVFDHFSWVPEWVIAFPLALPVVGIAYLILALRCRCRICGQGLFRSRPHLKDSRAHHIRGLGYIFPLCIHILLFHWFRCTHCGTPVRLKE
jgi:hypothetical protein